MPCCSACLAATSERDALTGGDAEAFLRRHLVNIAIGIVLTWLLVGLNIVGIQESARVRIARQLVRRAGVNWLAQGGV